MKLQQKTKAVVGISLTIAVCIGWAYCFRPPFFLAMLGGLAIGFVGSRLTVLWI